MMALTITLKEINDHLWKWDYEHPNVPYGLDEQDLTYATKIFSAAMWNVMWANRGDKDLEQMKGIFINTGSALREFIKQACGVDMHETIKKYG